MTMRLGEYECAVVRRPIVFRVNKVELRNSTGEAVDRSLRFISCTGYAECGVFPKGLPENVEQLGNARTGCPLSHAILSY